MKLTENFALWEFIRSNDAEQYNIDNTPTEDVKKNLKILCEEILQPAHDIIGQILGHEDYYIKITSGYRSDELNNFIGGSVASFHRFGFAGDCELYINGKESNALLYRIIEAQGKATELVWEGTTGTQPHQKQPKWVHVAYDSNDNRKMIKYRDV